MYTAAYSAKGVGLTAEPAGLVAAAAAQQTVHQEPVPSTRPATLGDCAFPVAAAWAWNAPSV